MTRALKITGIVMGSVVGLVLALLAVLLLLIDPNDYKPEIAELVKKKTDMDLVISDRLEWTLWPSIGVKLGKTSLTDPLAKEKLVAVDKAAVSVQLRPLLSKNIKIDAVTLEGARVRFITHADGTTSWDRMLAKLASAPAAEAESEKVAFNVKKLAVKNSSILLRDEKADVERALEDVTVTASDIGMRAAFPLQLGFTFRQRDAAGKTLIAKNTLVTTVQLDQEKELYVLNKLALTSALSGTSLPALATIDLKSDIRADMKAEQVALSALQLKATYADKALKSPATVDMTAEVLADLGKTVLSVNGLKLNASWPDAARPQALSAALAGNISTNWADGSLDASQLALNAVVPDKAYPQPLQVSYNGSLKGNWMQGNLSIAQFVLEAAGVRSKGALEARLPAMQATEPETPITKGMNISGNLSTAVFNPRNVMSALGIAAPRTADANVLKVASFSADIQGDEKKVLLKNIRLQLDDSLLTGEAGINDLVSMRQYARLSLDKMNADRYLPPAPAAAPANAKTSTPAAAPAAAGVLPVALLKTQNLDVALKAGSLNIMEYPVSNFRMAATAGKGVVNVSELKGNIYNGGFTVPVHINVQGAQPVLRLQPKLNHMEIAPLAKKFLRKDLLEGRASYTGDLTVRGNTVDAWMKSVSGSSDLKFENGVLHGVNAMKELTAALGKYPGLLALAGKDADTLAGKQNDTEIASFVAINTLDKGVVNSKSLDADLKKARVNGSGSFNLVTQALDYRFALNLDKSVVGTKNAGYVLPVQCRGNLAGSLASLCRLDSKAISDMALKMAAARGLEKLGLKGLDGKTPEAAVKDTVDEEKQKTREKLNEKLNEGLNKLFKR